MLAAMATRFPGLVWVMVVKATGGDGTAGRRVMSDTSAVINTRARSTTKRERVCPQSLSSLPFLQLYIPV